MLPQTRRVDIEDMVTPGNNSSVLEKCGRTHKLCLQREVPETHSSQCELLKTQINRLPFHLEENPGPCPWHSGAFRMFLWPHLLLLAFPHFVPSGPLLDSAALQAHLTSGPLHLLLNCPGMLFCQIFTWQVSSLDLHSNVSSLKRPPSSPLLKTSPFPSLSHFSVIFH